VLAQLGTWLAGKSATTSYTSNVKLLDTGSTWCGEAL
jgi:hypothetical protein